MSLTEIAAIGSLIVLAASGVDLVFQVRAIRRLLQREFATEASSHAMTSEKEPPSKARMRRPPPTLPSSSLGDSANVDWAKAGYVVWAYRSGTWTIVESRCPEGYAAGPAPSRPGRFENEHIRTPGVKIEK